MCWYLVSKLSLILLIPLVFVKCAKLNVPRVLLPYNHDIPSKFNLTVYGGGCYSWSCSREEVMLEEVKIEGCSHEAIVYAITKSKERITAIVLAKNLESGVSLRCDVIIDSIHRLEIVTTTRELYAEEAPEEFEVRAYDNQDNEFSTLEGQAFSWSLQTVALPKSTLHADMVLRFMSFEASSYETPPAIAALESKGKQGNKVLIEGSQTGVARLSVKLDHPAYQGLSGSEVQLMVIANLFLHPPNVYILPRTTVTYSVFQLKQGVFHHVDTVGSQYSLHVPNDDVGNLEEDGISVTGLNHGTTLVTLQDNNNYISSATQKYPTANLHVVDPSHLTITIFPDNYSALIVGNHYTFMVAAYDKNGNQIFLADNVFFETVVPSEFIATTFISQNGSYIDGIPLKTGSTKISAKLSSIQLDQKVIEISPPLKAALSLTIYDQIHVVPPFTYLPWDPIMKPLYKINLTVEGIHESITWSSNDNGVVEVNAFGHCQTKGNGEASVTAALTINPNNKDNAKIYIEEALQLVILKGSAEVEVGQSLSLLIAMSTSHQDLETYFTQCHQLPLEIKIQGMSFSYIDFEPSPGTDQSCVQAVLQSNQPGFSHVAIWYEGSKGKLEDVASISAFRHLKPQNPESGETVLAPGTSRIIIFEGGPLPWDHKLKNHFVKISLEGSEIGSARLIQKDTQKKALSDIHAILVECHRLGEFILSVTVGNKPSSSLPFPIQVSSSVTVICAIPDAISISTAISFPPGCPFNRNSQTVVAECSKSIPLQVTVFDSEGRAFDNISSLAINWEVSDSKLASFEEKQTHLETTLMQYGFPMPLATECILEPSGMPGEVSIQTTLKGLKNEPHIAAAFQKLQDSVKILLVKDVKLVPNELVLFNHRDIRSEILVSGGSGHFNLTFKEDHIASMKFEQQNNTIMVSPLADGTVNLNLVDLCLDPLTPALTVIRISSLSSLDLLMQDRVEVGSSIEAQVVAMDSLGRHIPVHSLMKLTSHPHDGSIIIPSFVSVNEKGNALLEVHGEKVGETTLRVSCKSGPKSVYSLSRPIHVFPKLTLLPRSITLIIGAVFQIETRGGPYHNAAVEFFMQNETIARVSATGIITACSLGTTQLTARSVSQLNDGQPFVVDSQDLVVILVIPLEKIHIHAPLRYIEAGNMMPLYALGSDGSQTPLSYATANPPLNFEWTLSNNQIAIFNMVYSENDVIESNENKGVIRFNALKPGRVIVRLKVSITQPASSQNIQIAGDYSLIDEIEIRVFESFKLTNPQMENAKILLSPSAETKIQTNRESEGNISFKYATDMASCGVLEPLISVSSYGIVKAGNVYGDATLIITLKEPYGVSQSIAVLVEVRPISYIEAVAPSFMKSSPRNYFPSVPLGASHRLKFTFHDNRGRSFTAVKTTLKCRPSRFDLVEVQPSLSDYSWDLTVRNDGQTVLHFWDESNSLINDFILIRSTHVISPDKTRVPLGSTVCFSTQLRDSAGSSGTWGSDSSRIKIDPTTGSVATLQVGNVSVWYKTSSAVIVNAELEITPIKKVSLQLPGSPISNIKRSDPWFIGIILESEDGLKSDSSCPDSNLEPPIPFKCLISFAAVSSPLNANDVFQASAAYLPLKGFGCLLEALVDSDMILATSSAELLLMVSVTAYGSQEAIQSPMSVVPFYPAAVIEKSEVVLTSHNPVATIDIHGAPTLLGSFVPISNDGKINCQLEGIKGTGGHLVITAKNVEWGSADSEETYLLSLISSLTHQKLEIVVSLEEGDANICPNQGKQFDAIGLALFILNNYQSIFLTIICLGITLIFLHSGYHSLVSPGYNQTQNTSVFASSPDLPPKYSPPNTPSSPSSSFSSSSPESFNRRPSSTPLWTIDKEPLYGKPLFRSSPRPAYEGSPTYSPCF